MAETLERKQTREIASASSDPLYIYGDKDFILSPQDPVFVHEANLRLEVYRDLERDPKVYAALQKRYDMTANAETVVRAARPRGRSTRAREKKAADMVAYQIESMGIDIEDKFVNAHARFDSSFNGAVYGILDAILMGYSVAEVIPNRDGREVYIESIKVRPQRRFNFDGDMRLRLLTKSDPMVGELLPTRKFLSYTFGSFHDPYGLGVGNRLYHPVRFKRLDTSFWLKFLDKYGSPTVVGKYPRNANSEDKDLVLEAAKAVQSDAAVRIPEDMMLELLQTIKTAAEQGYRQLFDTLNAEIAQAILGVTLTTEVKGEGSRAAAETHREEQQGVGLLDSIMLCNFLNSTIARWIVDWNMGTDVASPRIVKLFPNLSGLKEQATIDQLLWQIGFRRTLESVNELYAHGRDLYEVRPDLPTPGDRNEGRQASPPPSDEPGEKTRRETEENA